MHRSKTRATSIWRQYASICAADLGFWACQIDSSVTAVPSGSDADSNGRGVGVDKEPDDSIVATVSEECWKSLGPSLDKLFKLCKMLS